MSETVQPFPPVPLLPHPPTTPGTRIAPRARVWHRVLGVVLLVFGAAGGIGGLWGILVLTALFPWMREFVRGIPTGGVDPGLDAILGWKGWMAAVNAGAALAGALLVWAGIGLFRRRWWALRIVIAWAVVKMALVVVQAAATMQMQQDQFAHMQTTRAAIPPGLTTAMVVAGAVFILLWGWALPAFVLVWFGRASIRGEMRAWSAPGGARP